MIAIGNFTDAISKITQFANTVVNGEQEREAISLIVKIRNDRDEEINISPFVRYFVTEDTGMMLQEYEGGRLSLKPIDVKNSNKPNTIPARQVQGYYGVLPDALSNSELMERGAGNMHVNLTVVGDDQVHLETFPLLREAFHQYNIEFIISPSKILQPISKPAAPSGPSGSGAD